MNLEEAVPPNDIEAEDGVLASIFLDSKVLEQVRDTLLPRHFYRAGNGLIFQAMLSCAAAGLDPDTAAVKSRLKDVRAFDNVGGDERLAQLFDAVPSPANAVYFARRVCEKAAIRSARTAAVRFISHVDANPREPFSEARRVADELAESAHSAFNGGSGLEGTSSGGAKKWRFFPYGRLERQPRPDYIVDGLLVGGARMVLGGEPKKALKTWLLMQMGLCIATGQDFLGFKVPAAKRVLFYSGEEPRWRVQERLEKIGSGLGITDLDTPFFIAGDDVGQIRIDLTEHIDNLIELAKELKVDVVILEPFRRLHHAEENASSEIAPILDELTRLTRETGAAVVMSHHTVKNKEAKGAAALRGSGDLRSWYDVGMFSEARDKGGLEIEVESRDADVPKFSVDLKNFQGEHGQHCILLCRSAGQSSSDSAESDARRILGAKILLTIQKSERPLTKSAIYEQVGGKKQTVWDLLGQLKADGDITDTPLGFVYSTNPNTGVQQTWVPD